MLVLGFDPKLQLPVLDKWNVWRHVGPCGAKGKMFGAFLRLQKAGLQPMANRDRAMENHGESRRITET
jgi:hypothetical protein